MSLGWPMLSSAPMTTKSALDRLADYLAKRDHSEYELEVKLARRHTPEEIKEALAEAHDRKWILPPDELAEKVVRHLLARKKSTTYIRGYLRKLRLPEAEISAESEVDGALALLLRKFGGLDTLSWDDKQRAARYLSYRGFKPHLISKAIEAFQCRAKKSENSL